MFLLNSKSVVKLVFTLLIYIFISCGTERNDEEIKKDIPVTKETSENIIRTGVINVTDLDSNKDGKLYECPMDWNVISDNSGGCPVCEMKLKEFTTSEVKANLVRFGYETVE